MEDSIEDLLSLPTRQKPEWAAESGLGFWREGPRIFEAAQGSEIDGVNGGDVLYMGDIVVRSEIGMAVKNIGVRSPIQRANRELASKP
jgi:hypothetical protein